MKELVGYWSDVALHGGHSCWAYALKGDGTGFFEFINFVLMSFQPIRWHVKDDRLEIISDTQCSLEDFRTRSFRSEAFEYRAVFPFVIVEDLLAGRSTRVLTLDLENAQAPAFAKRFHPKRYGFCPHLRIEEYDPLRLFKSF